jgi:isopenicillin N synthase-like dioxygenase
MTKSEFNPEKKEQQLLEEATSWNTSSPANAEPGDIPIVDISAYLATGDRSDLDTAAITLGEACETVGFYQLVGHDISPGLIGDTFDAARRFHALPLSTKQQITMDRPDWPVRGAGYMPVGERKLPRRATGNLNEAFLIKSDRNIDFDDNQWLSEHELAGFRSAVETYARAVTDLALRLLPVYAVALGLEPDFFSPGFRQPFWRLRMTHYPPDTVHRNKTEAFGIAPHVDTTFFTLLLQDSPGLTIYSAKRGEWINTPVIDNAFVVNSGELLKQWSNDRFLSTRHFVNNSGHASRYSIPFFFNATADYPMACLPTCWDEHNPPKYPTISYLESQGVVQGE